MFGAKAEGQANVLLDQVAPNARPPRNFLSIRATPGVFVLAWYNFPVMVSGGSSNS
jgi:hypothetical protein